MAALRDTPLGDKTEQTVLTELLRADINPNIWCSSQADIDLNKPSNASFDVELSKFVPA